MCVARKRISFSEDTKDHDDYSKQLYTYSNIIFGFFGMLTKEDKIKKNIRRRICKVSDVLEITDKLEDILYAIKEVKISISSLESKNEDEDEADSENIIKSKECTKDTLNSYSIPIQGTGFISYVEMPNGSTESVINKFPHIFCVSEEKIVVDWEHEIFNKFTNSRTKKIKNTTTIFRSGTRYLNGKFKESNLPGLWCLLCLLEEVHNKLQLLEIKIEMEK